MAGKSFFRSATLTALEVLFSSGAFAAPNIGQMFVINGRLMFTIDTGSFVLQRKYGENWITQSALQRRRLLVQLRKRLQRSCRDSLRL